MRQRADGTGPSTGRRLSDCICGEQMSQTGTLREGQILAFWGGGGLADPAMLLKAYSCPISVFNSHSR